MSRMGNRLLRLTALTTALGAGLAGLTAADASTLKFMFQGDPYEVKVITETAKKFEAANPGTTIELINTPHDAYNEKVGAAVSANSLPDIMQLDAPFLANYVWSGFIQPIGPYIDKAVLDDMTASNVAQGTYPVDKQLYALGLTDSTVALYASRKQLTDLGVRIPTSVEDAWTKDEFEALLTKLSTTPGVKWPLDLFRSYGTKTEWITYAYEPVLASLRLRSDRPHHLEVRRHARRRYLRRGGQADAELGAEGLGRAAVGGRQPVLCGRASGRARLGRPLVLCRGPFPAG